MNWNNEGDSVYGKYSIKLNGALSSSINFDKFYLPNGTEMYIYNENGNMITGPITEKENSPNKIWGSWVYQGSWLTIEIRTPLSTLKQLVLHANNIAYGYKNVYQVGNFGQSASCEINVICPLGNGWVNERNSVALGISGDGSGLFSGALIMNTCATNRPYFLTANHVYEQARPVRNVTGWRFTFQAWSSTCPYPGTNSDGVTYNGSTFRASWAGSDFCLVELNTTPPTNSGINYAGWNRNTVGITQTTIIHHPRGDVMKITRDNDAPVAVVHPDVNNLNCWRLIVENGNGATEGGSSGSPYFDQNHRIIAQHYGISADQLNLPVCNQFTKYGGRFDVSWTGGGTNATRLSNWLDPSNSGAMTTNTTNVNLLIPGIVNPSITGNTNLCSSTTTYALNSNGTTYTGNVSWTSSNPNVASITPNGNPATLTQVSSGTVTITASVCGINTSKTVYVGSPSVNNFSFATSGPSCITGGGAPLSVGVTYNGYSGCDLYYQAGVTSVDWQIYASNQNYPYTVTYNAGIYTCSSPSQVNNAGLSVAFSYPVQPYVITFRYRINNGCGSSQWSPGNSVLIQACSGFNFIVSPNPTNGTLSIAFDESTLKNNTNSNIREIDIMDKFGNTVKRFSYGDGTKNVTVNISDLKTDVYFIKVFNGKEWKAQQVIKK